MNFQVLGQSRPGARKSLMEEKSILMNETERHELGETPGLILNSAQKKQLVNPMFRSFDVTIHQGRGGANTTTVGRADDLRPLSGRKLVSGEHETDIVVENFRRRSWQSVEAVI